MTACSSTMLMRASVCSQCLTSLHSAPTIRTLLPQRTLSRHPSRPLTRHLQTARFERYAGPPPPSSLPKPPSPKPRRPRRWPRRLLYVATGVGAVYLLDRQLYASALARSLRTFTVGLVVAADYKINFRAAPPLAPSIEAVHARNARRLCDLLRTNGGLYLKIGQAIAMQSAVLPPAFQQMFAQMFDDAPQNSWAEVRQVIRQEFGREVEEVFGVACAGQLGAGERVAAGVMETTARASASVAQVHWARLPDGREVAVKIQKQEIAAQVGWDLWAFKVVAWTFSKWFDIPFYTFVPYVTERLMLETDFQNEADNSERMARLVAAEPRLRDRVYIPKVYRELTTRRVMTAEWIEGVRLWDKKSITGPWHGSRREGSPGSHGAPLDPPSHRDMQAAMATAGNEHVKPDRTWWKGPDGEGGLGLSLKEVMTTMVDLFSAQMFLWGWVHCDPHPGNIFIRRLANGRSELVLIDHGLYIEMAPAFRHQYCRFWKALLTFDNATLAAVGRAWGINSPDLFASATLMRPYAGGDHQTRDEIGRMSRADKAQRAYEMQVRMRKGLKDILGDEDKWPHELIFIGRNLRIVQGNNQFLGSPVNRIKITGTWASRALAESPDLTLGQKTANLGRHVIFTMVMFSSDLVFWFSKLRQWLGRGRGMEDDIEAQMKVMAKDFGVDLNHGVFDGYKELRICI